MIVRERVPDELLGASAPGTGNPFLGSALGGERSPGRANKKALPGALPKNSIICGAYVEVHTNGKGRKVYNDYNLQCILITTLLKQLHFNNKDIKRYQSSDIEVKGYIQSKIETLKDRIIPSLESLVA